MAYSRRRAFVVALIVAVLGLPAFAACDRAPAFQGTVIESAPIAPELPLIDGASGEPFALRGRRADVTVVYFGYTHCPDVCPLTMGSLAAAVRSLPADQRDAVRVVMVTVDPERDTPEVMARYVAHFESGFIGLSGPPDDVARVLSDWAVDTVRGQADASGTYFMSHPAGVNVLDSRNRLRLVIHGDAEPTAIASDLRLLLRES
ncbi:MAG: SCO family protein [Dehalococcoidia bacterium]